MSYKITVTRKAIKALEKISEPHYSQIKTSIYQLAEDPRPIGCKKLKGRDGYRIRVGNYRIIYEIFDQILTIDIIAVGHRKDIYD